MACFKREDLDALMKADLDNPDEVSGIIQKIQQPKWHEIPIQLFMNNALVSIGSFGRDFVGNGLKAASTIPVKALGALIEKPLAKLHGRAAEKYVGETLPHIYGMMEGVQDGLQRSWIALSRDLIGSDPAGREAVAVIEKLKAGHISQKEATRMLSRLEGHDPDVVMSQSKVFEGGLPPLRRVKSRFVRTHVAPWFELGWRGHGSVDQLYKGIAEGSELRVLAYRDARKNGLSGGELETHISNILKDPPPEMLEKVAERGRVDTFQRALDKYSAAFSRMTSDVPFLKLFVPFVRTSTNILKESLKFTAFNIPRSLRMAIKDAPDAAEELAKAAIGSTLMTWAAFKHQAGEIVGPAPEGAAERDAFYQQGKVPNSVKIGDQWVPFGQMEPFGMPLSLVASAGEGFKRAGDGATSREKLTLAFGLMLQSQMDKTYLSGLADIADLRSGKSDALARQLATMAIPEAGLSRNIANLVDTRYTERRRFVDSFMELIPGIKNELPGKQSRFGEDLRRTPLEAIGPTGTALVPSRVTDDEVELALEELGLRVGFPGQKVFGEKLEPDEYRAFLATVGPRTKEFLATLLQDSDFRALDTANQQKLLDNSVGKIRDQARAEALLGLVPGVPPVLVRRELTDSLNAFQGQRQRLERSFEPITKAPGRTGGATQRQLQQDAQEAWGPMLADLTKAVADARRRGLSEDKIRTELMTRRIPRSVADAILAGQPVTYKQFRGLE